MARQKLGRWVEVRQTGDSIKKWRWIKGCRVKDGLNHMGEVVLRIKRQMATADI